MEKWEQSRQEWEQEIREIQQNITPAEGLRAAHHVAKGTSGAPIPDLAHFIRLVLGGALLGLGIVAFSSRLPHSNAIGVAALTAGFFLAYTALR